MLTIFLKNYRKKEISSRRCNKYSTTIIKIVAITKNRKKRNKIGFQESTANTINNTHMHVCKKELNLKVTDYLEKYNLEKILKSKLKKKSDKKPPPNLM